jgi:CBS domain containing-hemolysin-like protein
VRKLGIEPQEELASVRTLDELELLIRASGEEGTIDARSLTLLTRTLRFGHKTAADALVPRTEVRTVSTDDTIADLIRAAVETGFSRFPVVGADLDELVGVAHVKDAYRLPPEERLGAPVAGIMREVLAVPETRELASLLAELRSRGSHLAAVIDEFGGTAGIITMEDILEEIVGEIDDEYDPSARGVAATVPPDDLGPIESPSTERRSWTLPGSLHPDEVLDGTGFHIPEGEYETIAGFVLERLGHIPEAGEHVRHEDWDLEVLAVDRHRIASLLLTHDPTAAPEGDEP